MRQVLGEHRSIAIEVSHPRRDGVRSLYLVASGADGDFELKALHRTNPHASDLELLAIAQREIDRLLQQPAGVGQ